MKLITQELLNELIVKTKINITRTEELKTQSEETLNFKESQDKWSVLECIEHLNLYGELSGLENLEYFVGLSGRKYDKGELINFLEQAGLQEAAHQQRVKTFSKGMRQKVGVAMAIAKKAKVLLLDEPTSGLDPKASNEFSKLLVSLSELNVATLMATHDLFRAKETGTDIGIMKSGKLVEQLSTQDIGHSDLERLYLNHMNN